MKDLFDHPGFMAYGAGPLLFEILHADWPVYPAGHGWQPALKSLAVFPSNIRFQQIDHIDKCRLFIAVGSGPSLEPTGNLFGSNWFHVAIWDDDLVELKRRDLVHGLSLLTEYEEALAFYEKYKDTYFRGKRKDAAGESATPGSR